MIRPHQRAALRHYTTRFNGENYDLQETRKKSIDFQLIEILLTEEILRQKSMVYSLPPLTGATAGLLNHQRYDPEIKTLHGTGFLEFLKVLVSIFTP